MKPINNDLYNRLNKYAQHILKYSNICNSLDLVHSAIASGESNEIELKKLIKNSYYNELSSKTQSFDEHFTPKASLNNIGWIQCKKCLNEMSFDYFYLNKGVPSSTCKKCHKQQRKLYYHNHEKIDSVAIEKLKSYSNKSRERLCAEMPDSYIKHIICQNNDSIEVTNGMINMVKKRILRKRAIKHRTPNMKLSENQVINILIERLMNGDKTVTVAKKYNIHYSVIGAICRGRTWKHITLPFLENNKSNYALA